MSGDSKGYIAALDIGTTKIKCHILNSSLTAVGSAYTYMKLHYPNPGYVEINPQELWDDIISVIKRAIYDGNISIMDLKSIGISTQRGTFITWRKSTGKPLHNFITWKDIRSQYLVKYVNRYLTIRMLKLLAFIGYIFTRNTKLFVASRMVFSSSHTSVRLLWVLTNMPEVQEALQEDDVMFGTVDTWLIYKFTNSKTFITDITNVSATGLFDPFILDWGIMCSLLNIPKKILPQIVENDYNFGEIDKDIFGKAIQIGCVISDQSSSMIGACCFQENDLKVTLGTGAFLNVNTGNSIHGSSSSMYPLVAWKLGNEYLYMSEVACNDSGSLIEWAKEADFIKSPSESLEMANKVQSNGGVYYIAAFSGLGPPLNDEDAGSGFIGIKPTTRKEHMVRAILESIAFRVALTVKFVKEDRPANYKRLRIDGGVAVNNFICQMLADITGLNIERLVSTELSIIGAGFLAGVSAGLWKDMKELNDHITVEKTFYPSTDKIYRSKCIEEMDKWLRAASRFKSWYTGEDNSP